VVVQGEMSLLNEPVDSLLGLVKETQSEDPFSQRILKELGQEGQGRKGFTVVDGALYRNDKFYVPQ